MIIAVKGFSTKIFSGVVYQQKNKCPQFLRKSLKEIARKINKNIRNSNGSCKGIIKIKWLCKAVIH